MWRGATWYYPLQQEQSLAMAIEFVDDSARHVEFFQALASRSRRKRLTGARLWMLTASPRCPSAFARPTPSM